MRVLANVALAAWLGIGCGGDDTPAVLGDERPTDNPTHRLTVDGMPGVPNAATGLLQEILALPVTVNGVQGSAPMIVDTGSPYTFVIPDAYPGATLPMGSGDVATLAFGGLTVHDAPVVAVDPLGLTGVAAGILGVNLICRYAATFDYQAHAITFGEPPGPGDTEPPVTLPFTLRGGGYGRFPGEVQARYYGPTRLLVPVQIDGQSLTLLFDTGASITALRPSVFARLTSDGRRTLSIRSVMQTGVSQRPIARARSVQLAGVSVADAPMSELAEESGQSISEESGVVVDGLLGLSFSRHFRVTIDYPHGALTLRRYRDQSFYRDQFVRAGLALETDGAGMWRVGIVFSGSHAATQGLAQGATVRAIDGRELGMMTPAAADELLRGAVGETRALTLQDRTVTVNVEDLLR